MAKQ
ncbi:hypothetical protein VCHC56A2_0008, partial [Vibrio cholerae HC-56A2]|jgi:hypothetical protein